MGWNWKEQNKSDFLQSEALISDVGGHMTKGRERERDQKAGELLGALYLLSMGLGAIYSLPGPQLCCVYSGNSNVSLSAVV